MTPYKPLFTNARLDGDQPAKPMAKHEHRPDTQRPSDGEQDDAKPADRLAIECPEPDPVGVGRQIAAQQSEHRDRREDPAVIAILQLAGAEVSAAEQRCGDQPREYDHKGDQDGMGEEGGGTTRAQDREPEIGKARTYRNDGHSAREHASRAAGPM
jgi:hypothetical protein